MIFLLWTVFNLQVFQLNCCCTLLVPIWTITFLFYQTLFKPLNGIASSSYKVTTMGSLCLLQSVFLIFSYLMFHVSWVVFAKCANRTTGTCWPYKCHTNTVWESLTVTVKVVVFVPFCPNAQGLLSQETLQIRIQTLASFSTACQKHPCCYSVLYLGQWTLIILCSKYGIFLCRYVFLGGIII